MSDYTINTLSDIRVNQNTHSKYFDDVFTAFRVVNSNVKTNHDLLTSLSSGINTNHDLLTSLSSGITANHELLKPLSSEIKANYDLLTSLSSEIKANYGVLKVISDSFNKLKQPDNNFRIPFKMGSEAGELSQFELTNQKLVGDILVINQKLDKLLDPDGGSLAPVVQRLTDRLASDQKAFFTSEAAYFAVKLLETPAHEAAFDVMKMLDISNWVRNTPDNLNRLAKYTSEDVSKVLRDLSKPDSKLAKIHPGLGILSTPVGELGQSLVEKVDSKSISQTMIDSLRSASLALDLGYRGYQKYKDQDNVIEKIMSLTLATNLAYGFIKKPKETTEGILAISPPVDFAYQVAKNPDYVMNKIQGISPPIDFAYRIAKDPKKAAMESIEFIFWANSMVNNIKKNIGFSTIDQFQSGNQSHLPSSASHKYAQQSSSVRTSSDKRKNELTYPASGINPFYMGGGMPFYPTTFVSGKAEDNKTIISQSITVNSYGGTVQEAVNLAKEVGKEAVKKADDKSLDQFNYGAP